MCEKKKNNAKLFKKKLKLMFRKLSLVRMPVAGFFPQYVNNDTCVSFAEKYSDRINKKIFFFFF